VYNAEMHEINDLITSAMQRQILQYAILLYMNESYMAMKFSIITFLLSKHSRLDFFLQRREAEALPLQRVTTFSGLTPLQSH
jgi:hypothetical protein